MDFEDKIIICCIVGLMLIGVLSIPVHGVELDGGWYDSFSNDSSKDYLISLEDKVSMEIYNCSYRDLDVLFEDRTDLLRKVLIEFRINNYLKIKELRNESL